MALGDQAVHLVQDEKSNLAQIWPDGSIREEKQGERYGRKRGILLIPLKLGKNGVKRRRTSSIS